MIPIPSGVRVWLATGHTDLRKGFASLSLQVQEVLRQDPLGGHLFCFRGRRGDLLKVIWHDGPGRVPVHEEAGTGPLFVAERSRRRGDDLAGPARLPFVGDRLASSPGNLASDLGRVTIRVAAGGGCDSIGW
jgi:hypothetical protein